MELVQLRRFAEAARSGSLTAAALALHVSQPALSRDVKALEDELGRTLFIRKSRSLELTADGQLLLRRAADILEMSERTKSEFRSLADEQGGEVTVGCAESAHLGFLAEAVEKIRPRFPRMKFHLVNSDSQIVFDRLERSLIDLAIVMRPASPVRFNCVKLPVTERWAAVMRADDPLSRKRHITPDDLRGRDLIVPQLALNDYLSSWFGERLESLEIAGTSNLFFNGTVFVRKGRWIMLCLEGLVENCQNALLCSRPLKPALESSLYLVWRKHQHLIPAAQCLLDELKQGAE
ncbi:MAG: LysR family transcriptional regulator [Succinivibrio sp.]|jgi:DNA-binding transcriptional LysR family regulator|nr:LysR family transcriptional regulator [Succinivibrio sp.]